MSRSRLAKLIQSEEGTLHLAFAMVTWILALLFIGIHGLHHHWKKLVEIQLRLDQCVEKKALLLRDRMNSMERDNQRMTELRDSIVDAEASEQLVAAAAFRATLTAVAMHENVIRAEWMGHRLSWRLGCDGGRDQGVSFPDFPWTAQPPDAVGAKPMQLQNLVRLKIQLSHSPRHAAAEIYEGDLNGETQWKAKWALPGRSFKLRSGSR